MPAFSIGESAADVRLGCGWTCAIDAADIAALEATLEDLLALPGAELCAGYGLIGNLKVLENIVLPVVYHGVIGDLHEVEREIAAAFADCGVSAEEARGLYYRLPGELTAYETRLAVFVRTLVMRGEIIVYSRFFEGLTREGMERVAALNEVFLHRHPRGTAVYLGLSDMPAIEPRCDRRIAIGNA